MPYSTNISTLIGAYNREKQAKGCMADAYALQILFVYFLTLPSLLHPSILLFFILVQIETIIEMEQLVLSATAQYYLLINYNA